MRGKGIWALRIVLAIAFLFFGLMKFQDRSPYVTIFEQIGFGQWFRYVTGVIEIAGAVLLLAPRATPIAVLLLAPTMVGALLTHVLVIGPQPASVVVLLLLFGVLVVGWSQRRR